MYCGFAEFYNKEIPDRYYEEVSDFFCKIMKKYAKPYYSDNNIVLDCGCGTGILTKKLFAEGYDMIGLDISEDMLEVAKSDLKPEEKKILWICQDMRKMDLFGTVAGIICATDTVSHLICDGDMKKFFSKISNFLEPGGVFVFDVLTENYFKKKINGNVFYDDEEDCTCVWQGKYSEKTKICRYDITVFETKDGHTYERYDDTVKEKAYSYDESVKFIINSGLEIIGCYGGTKKEKVDDTTERMYFAVKKPEIKKDL